MKETFKKEYSLFKASLIMHVKLHSFSYETWQANSEIFMVKSKTDML